MEAVARRHVDRDPKTTTRIDNAPPQAEFGLTTYDGLKRLAIDEVAVKIGHNYMTVGAPGRGDLRFRCSAVPCFSVS